MGYAEAVLVFYIILALCTLTVLGVVFVCYRHIRRHMTRAARASAAEKGAGGAADSGKIEG